ncbi:MAG: F0F1 ATP synthase subunit C [Alphaproteobacteria bacterium]|nr:F0F1 ATP synthase subunit C [Alphaproteobacteria bacterium]
MEASAAKLIAAGLALIGVAGVGVGVGLIFSSMISAVARNPSAQKQLNTPLYIGFAVTEALGLFCVVIAFLILFVF